MKRRPPPLTRPMIYALACTADIPATLARRAMIHGLDVVADPIMRGRIETAVRVLGWTLPATKEAA